MGPGQRTMAVPMRRHPLVLILRLGSKQPKRLPKMSTDGARLSAAANAIITPIEAGIPRL
ncbi:Uncharacterised protein [Mycobacterium tuberculosis]|nr:Uncharacterised protein [Mycobacterium tuberculosis]